MSRNPQRDMCSAYVYVLLILVPVLTVMYEYECVITLFSPMHHDSWCWHVVGWIN